MLFDEYTPIIDDYGGAPVEPSVIYNTLAFDWDAGRWVMESGSPVLVNGGNALKEWLELVTRIRQERYPIYPADFGGAALDLVGKKIPKGYGLSEFKRKMTETAAYNPGIANIDNFVYDGEAITFDVYMTDGTKEVAEIEY